jgi:hypothetical protein
MTAVNDTQNWEASPVQHNVRRSRLKGVDNTATRTALNPPLTTTASNSENPALMACSPFLR